MENAVQEKKISGVDVGVALAKVWKKLRVDTYLNVDAVKDHPRFKGGSSVDFFYDGEILIDEVAEAMVDVGLFPDFGSVPYESDGLAAKVADAVYKRLKKVESNRRVVEELRQNTCDILNGTDLEMFL